MESIEDRLDELQRIGAGDSQCVECLAISIEPFSVCRKCIADTPEFTELVRSVMSSKKQ